MSGADRWAGWPDDWRHVTAWDGPAMGGRLSIDLTLRSGGDAVPALGEEQASRRAMAVAHRVDRWAARVTRFDRQSELCRLNANPADAVAVGPTVAAVLRWAHAAQARSGGIVDVTLLEARLAAEHRGRSGAAAALGAMRGAAWQMQPGACGGVVHRPAGVQFDLDGVAKGWLADRSLRLLDDLPGAIVDADGDIAIRVARGDIVTVGIADPGTPGALLATLRLTSGRAGSAYGVATSGITVHRWQHDAGLPPSHHLIDPRTGGPAETDIVQATVLAASARDAEVLAKTAVILGSGEGIRFVERAGAIAAVILTAAGQRLATLGSIAWLEAA